MKFEVYGTSKPYTKIIWGVFTAFFKNPEIFKTLFKKLSPILEYLLIQNPDLDSKVNKELDDLGRNNEPSIIKAIWILIVWGDEILGQTQENDSLNLYKVRVIAFDKFQNFLQGLDKRFVELVLSIWVVKQKDGKSSFTKYWHSLDEYWKDLTSEYPEFSGPGVLLPIPESVTKTSKPIPKTQTSRSQLKPPRKKKDKSPVRVDR